MLPKCLSPTHKPLKRCKILFLCHKYDCSESLKQPDQSEQKQTWYLTFACPNVHNEPKLRGDEVYGGQARP